MTKVLYISRDVKGIHTGASVVTNRNCQLLKDVFGAENVLEKHIYPVRSKSKLLSLTLKRYMGGLTPEIEQEVVKLVSDHHIPVIAIDSSLLGRLSKVLKKKFPACRIMIFFHNTEYYYFKSLLTTTRKIWHYSSVRAALYNERLSCEYADDLITLNERDADDLYKVYTRKGDLVIPVTYADRFDSSKVISAEEVTALFVGTLFFPNYQE